MWKAANEVFIHIEEQDASRFYSDKAAHMCGFSFLIYPLYHAHGKRFNEFVEFVNDKCRKEDYKCPYMNDLKNGFTQVIGSYLSDYGYICDEEICLVPTKIAKEINLNKLNEGEVPDNRGHILDLWD